MASNPHTTPSPRSEMTSHQQAVTPLEKACIDLNSAIDAYWNSDYGLRLTGMGENFIITISEAQQKCKAALEAEGVKLGSNP